MNERIKGLKTAAPYLRIFKGKTFVIKLGGEVLKSPDVLHRFTDQVSLLHQLTINIVLVHGGGAQASEMAHRLHLPVQKIGGRRVTCAETLEVAKMVFNKLNTDILAALRRSFVPSVGLSGVDGGLIEAHRRPKMVINDPETGGERSVDFGHVGDIDAINPAVISHLLGGGYVPVVSALAGDDDGAVYNVNADTIAAKLAGAIKAEKLILLTNVAGVFSDPDDPTTLISHMDRELMEQMIEKGAEGGMKAKLEACREALAEGVPRTHIISGIKQDSLLAEIFTNEGSGTLIELTRPAWEQEVLG